MADRFEASRDVLREAIEHLAFPCAVVEVGSSTHVRWTEPFGSLTFGARAAPATRETIFDLASLTKVLATAPLLMRAIEQGVLGLDDAVATHVQSGDGPTAPR